MKIENSQMLQTQMDMGSGFKLDNQGNIKTQGKVGEFFQSIGDKFRSAETINARNEKLMVAMGTMLRDGDAAAPLNGPQNLAAPPAMNAQNRAAVVNDAKKAIMQSAISRHVETTYGDQSKGVQDAIQRHILTQTSASNAKNLTEVKSAVNQEIARFAQNPAELTNRLSKCAYLPAKSHEDLAPQRTHLNNVIKQNIAGDIGKHKEFPNNTYNSYTLDAPRNLPIFEGVKTTQENHGSALAQFSKNPVEQRMVAYICSQTLTFNFLASFLGQSGPPPSEAHANPASPLMFSLANRAPFNISRDDNGDVLISKQMGLSAQGSYDGVLHNSSNLGNLDFTIRVPQEQFADFADANDKLAKLETQEKKDDYMTGLLKNFEPQIEISHMTLTPPAE